MKQHIETLLAQSLEIIALEDNLSLTLPDNLTIERPKEALHGDFSTNIALVMTKETRMPPKVLATRILKNLPASFALQNINIAGPGFINFSMSDAWLLEQIETLWLSKTCGVAPSDNPQTIVIDYSSPNLAKEMHVGHLRSTIIGDAIARILEYQGHTVIRQNHVGDWGTQFGMLLAHLEDLNQQSTEVVLQDLEAFYKSAKQRFDTEPAFAERARQCVVLLQAGDVHFLQCWNTFIQLSLSHCQQLYQRLWISLKPEHVQAESAFNPVLPDIVSTLRQKGLLVEHEGAQCVFLDEFIGKENEPLPIIVQKKDGGFLYASTDLAALDYRNKTLQANRILYVVDARQALHFQQIFALGHKAGFVPSDTQLEHVSFGMILDKSGKPFKSREGGVTKLADLLDEAVARAKTLIASKQPDTFSEETLQEMANLVGIASVKYADLSKNRTSNYIFDWDTMLNFEGNTAPYLLYAYTRIHSLFQKAHCSEDNLQDPLLLESKEEILLAKHLIQFPEIIGLVAVKTTPHVLCTWLFELAGFFSSFYEACPILNQDNPDIQASRLKLSALTARILKQGLALLGIPVLTRM